MAFEKLILSVILPLLWPTLREPEKWQVGQAYAEVNAHGNRTASAGLKSALLKVQGFDFVPETLRSSTFSETAARVLAAHYGYNNFSNECEPMENLANLGTAIPRPAFPKCMEAILAVWLGNHWGNSWASESFAKSVLDSLRTEQWEYYLNECLRRDRTVLDKLSSEKKPIARWIQLVEEYGLKDRTISNLAIRNLIQSSVKKDIPKVMERAEALRIGAIG